jgi:hypothetical protein
LSTWPITFAIGGKFADETVVDIRDDAQVTLRNAPGTRPYWAFKILDNFRRRSSTHFGSVDFRRSERQRVGEIREWIGFS